jgi:hypothetical protein
MESHHAPLAAAATIEPDVVRAESGRETGGEEEVGVEARNLEIEIAAALVPVERKIPVDFEKAGDAVLYGRGRGARRLLLRDENTRAGRGAEACRGEHEGRVSKAHGVSLAC